MSLCQPCPSAGRSTPPAGGISPSMLVHFFHLSSTFMQDCLETFSLLLGLRSWRGARICPPALGGQVSWVGVVLVAVYVMATTEQGLVKVDISSVQFSHSAVSDSLRSHESQHARPPCPSPTPGVYPNSCPSRQWCHPTISSSVVLFSSCPQSLPASGSFPMSQLFVWVGQSIELSALASVLPKNTQDWFPLGWTGWISLQSKGLSRVFSNITVQKHQFSVLSFPYSPTLTSTHDHWQNERGQTCEAGVPLVSERSQTGSTHTHRKTGLTDSCLNH